MDRLAPEPCMPSIFCYQVKMCAVCLTLCQKERADVIVAYINSTHGILFISLSVVRPVDQGV